MTDQTETLDEQNRVLLSALANVNVYSAEDLTRFVEYVQAEARALATPPAAGLDVERLARAFHEAKKVGGPWGPCATRTADGDMVLVGFDEDPNGDFACLCRAMAGHVASEYVKADPYRDADGRPSRTRTSYDASVVTEVLDQFAALATPPAAGLHCASCDMHACGDLDD